MKLRYVSALSALIIASSTFALGTEDYIGSIGMTAAQYCPNGTLEANGQILSTNDGSYQALFSLIGCSFGGDCRTTFALPDMRGRTPVGYGQSPGLTNVQFAKPRGQENMTLSANNLPAHTHSFAPTTGSQNITIPATTGTNTTLSGTVGVVPAQGNTGNDFTPEAGKTYQLAGASVNGGTTMVGPYSVTSLPNPSAYVSGVSVNASEMTPNIPAKTVAITTVTGGAVGANSTVQSTSIVTIPPQLGLRYCIVWNGIYPPRP